MVSTLLPSTPVGLPLRRVLAPIPSFRGTGLSIAGTSRVAVAAAVTADVALLADLPGPVPRGAPV